MLSPRLMLAIGIPFLGYAFLWPAAAEACTCAHEIGPTTRAQRKAALATDVKSTFAIFIGEVVAADQFRATLKVERVWKGNVGAEVAMSTGQFRTGPDQLMTDTCVINYWRVGAKYLVFAQSSPALSDDRALMRAERCGRTMRAPLDDETLRLLDEITSSKPGPSDNPQSLER